MAQPGGLTSGFALHQVLHILWLLIASYKRSKQSWRKNKKTLIINADHKLLWGLLCIYTTSVELTIVRCVVFLSGLRVWAGERRLGADHGPVVVVVVDVDVRHVSGSGRE